MGLGSHTQVHHTAKSQKTPRWGKSTQYKHKNMASLIDLPTSKRGQQLPKQNDIHTLSSGGLQFSSYVPDIIKKYTVR